MRKRLRENMALLQGLAATFVKRAADGHDALGEVMADLIATAQRTVLFEVA